MNKQVLSLVRDCLLAPLILTFREFPTFDTYMSLTRDAPYIAPSLLEVTRQKLRGNMRSRVLRMGWRAAAMVFCECGMPSDFWSLSKALATVPMDDDVLGALLAMAGHPKADFTLPGEDTMAALLFKVALRCAVSSCWLRIAQHYPGWDRAWDWLDDAVQDGTLSAQIPPDATTKQKADRSLSVAKFGKLLGPGAKPKSAAGTDVPSPSVAGQKRSLDEAIGAGADDWGRARDVRKCLDVLRGSRFTTREAVDVPAVAEYALGSHYLATIEGIFNIIHESFVIISWAGLRCAHSQNSALAHPTSLPARRWSRSETFCAISGTCPNRRPVYRAAIHLNPALRAARDQQRQDVWSQQNDPLLLCIYSVGRMREQENTGRRAFYDTKSSTSLPDVDDASLKRAAFTQRSILLSLQASSFMLTVLLYAAGAPRDSEWVTVTERAPRDV